MHDDRRADDGREAEQAAALDERDRLGPVPGAVPNEEEAKRAFERGTSAPLREQRDLVDADGDDIRQYTGEPVETDDGVVIPQQTLTGAANEVGGGEFPNTPGRGDTPGDELEDKGTDDPSRSQRGDEVVR